MLSARELKVVAQAQVCFRACQIEARSKQNESSDHITPGSHDDLWDEWFNGKVARAPGTFDRVL